MQDLLPHLNDRLSELPNICLGLGFLFIGMGLLLRGSWRFVRLYDLLPLSYSAIRVISILCFFLATIAFMCSALRGEAFFGQAEVEVRERIVETHATGSAIEALHEDLVEEVRNLREEVSENGIRITTTYDPGATSIVTTGLLVVLLALFITLAVYLFRKEPGGPTTILAVVAAVIAAAGVGVQFLGLGLQFVSILQPPQTLAACPCVQGEQDTLVISPPNMVPEWQVIVDSMPAFQQASASEPEEPLRARACQIRQRFAETRVLLAHVLGSYDRRELLAPARARYGSNLALAQQRAEYVKGLLTDPSICEGTPAVAHVITGVAGPRYTNSPDTWELDRKVEIIGIKSELVQE